jgi:hypothetical protein
MRLMMSDAAHRTAPVARPGIPVRELRMIAASVR